MCSKNKQTRLYSYFLIYEGSKVLQLKYNCWTQKHILKLHCCLPTHHTTVSNKATMHCIYVWPPLGGARS